MSRALVVVRITLRCRRVLFRFKSEIISRDCERDRKCLRSYRAIAVMKTVINKSKSNFAYAFMSQNWLTFRRCVFHLLTFHIQDCLQNECVCVCVFPFAIYHAMNNCFNVKFAACQFLPPCLFPCQIPGIFRNCKNRFALSCFQRRLVASQIYFYARTQ
jgi:hypothetical protein